MIELSGLNQQQVEDIIPQTPALVGYRGSIAHGMYVPNTDPNSIDDKDVMGVCIPPNNLLPVLSLWHNVSSRVSRTRKLVEQAAFSEAVARSHASVACYSSSENVFVLAVVEPKYKLVKVQREVLPADAVIRAKHSALQKTPERFDGVRVNDTANVFAAHVSNGLMGILPMKLAVHSSIVRHEHANVRLLCNHVDEAFHRGCVRSAHHLANDIALASNRANNGHFVRSAANSRRRVG